jgi:hypothetical protein
MKYALIACTLLFSAAAQAAPVTLPCKSTVEDWNKTVPGALEAKTCVLYLARDYSYGKCDRRSEEYWDGREWKSYCVRWASITWTKTANLVCGGLTKAQVSQSCSGSRMSSQEELDKAFTDYDYSLVSIFLEQLTLQNFRMSHTEANGKTVYFERR